MQLWFFEWWVRNFLQPLLAWMVVSSHVAPVNTSKRSESAALKQNRPYTSIHDWKKHPSWPHVDTDCYSSRWCKSWPSITKCARSSLGCWFFSRPCSNPNPSTFQFRHQSDQSIGRSSGKAPATWPVAAASSVPTATAYGNENHGSALSALEKKPEDSCHWVRHPWEEMALI